MRTDKRTDGRTHVPIQSENGNDRKKVEWNGRESMSHLNVNDVLRVPMTALRFASHSFNVRVRVILGAIACKLVRVRLWSSYM